MASCVWVEVEGGVVCTRCGAIRPTPRNRQCGDSKVFDEKTLPCRNEGEALGRNELIRCETCQGNVRIKFCVHACTVHGECLPGFTGDGSEAMSCGKCRALGLGFEPQPLAG